MTGSTIPHSERARQIADKLTKAQRSVLCHLTDEPTAAQRGGAWSAIAAFNLVLPGCVKLHQSFYGDRYSLTPLGLQVRQILQESPPQ